MIAEPAILAEDLVFSHPGGFELRLPRVRVNAGERVALIGPSGSGKSTLIDLISGIKLPTGGRVVVLGHDWRTMPERQRRDARLASIGMAFQEFELLGYLSARDNIELVKFVGGRSAGELRERSEMLASKAGILHAMGRPPSRLSQGERQRVALCRALLTRPPLLLCDEPTGNLDPATTDAVIDLLLAQSKEDGSTVMLATHDHGLLKRFDRVIELPGRTR